MNLSSLNKIETNRAGSIKRLTQVLLKHGILLLFTLICTLLSVRQKSPLKSDLVGTFNDVRPDEIAKFSGIVSCSLRRLIQRKYEGNNCDFIVCLLEDLWQVLSSYEILWICTDWRFDRCRNIWSSLNLKIIKPKKNKRLISFKSMVRCELLLQKRL